MTENPTEPPAKKAGLRTDLPSSRMTSHWRCRRDPISGSYWECTDDKLIVHSKLSARIASRVTSIMDSKMPSGSSSGSIQRIKSETPNEAADERKEIVVVTPQLIPRPLRAMHSLPGYMTNGASPGKFKCHCAICAIMSCRCVLTHLRSKSNPSHSPTPSAG
jgi:hypothetical protein